MANSFVCWPQQNEMCAWYFELFTGEPDT